MTQVDNALLLLDDGNYYVSRTCIGGVATHGFLRRRTDPRNISSDDDVCVGMYERAPSGKWRASIVTSQKNEDFNDVLVLGAFRSTIEAISALWTARRHVDADIHF